MMDVFPLISVGIPTYNRPGGLEKTVACIRSQTYTHIEIIISDNCSTDPGVAPLLSSLSNKDARIKVFRQKENVGLAKNFQFVLSHATGKYFMWISDDDLVEDNFIMELCKVLEQFPDAHLAIPELVLYNAQHKKEYTSGKYASLENGYPRQRVYGYFRQPIKINYFYGLYRREVVSQFEFTPKMFGADLLISMCMAFSGKVILSSSTSYIYYMGGNSFDTERLGKVLGLPAWKVPLWGFNDAFYVAGYILRHPAFDVLPAYRRTVFCVKAFFLMLKNTKALQSFVMIMKRKTFRLLLNRPTLRKSNN